MRNVISAYTSFRNTKESDNEPMVFHDVNVGDEIVRLMAKAPDDAISKVQNMSNAEFLALERIPKT